MRETTVISRRELARELRRKAYRDAKARRDADPRFLAMKEAAKQRRRELYRVAKEKKKAAASSAASVKAREVNTGPSRDRGIKESSSKASARAALAQALEALRETREQRAAREAVPQEVVPQEVVPQEVVPPMRELLERVIQTGERDGAANDQS